MQKASLRVPYGSRIGGSKKKLENNNKVIYLMMYIVVFKDMQWCNVKSLFFLSLFKKKMISTI